MRERDTTYGTNSIDPRTVIRRAIFTVILTKAGNFPRWKRTLCERQLTNYYQTCHGDQSPSRADSAEPMTKLLAAKWQSLRSKGTVEQSLNVATSAVRRRTNGSWSSRWLALSKITSASWVDLFFPVYYAALILRKNVDILYKLLRRMLFSFHVCHPKLSSSTWGVK